MSGAGGFYKYRCKYFYTHNCPNWVWVNNAPCASCLVSWDIRFAYQFIRLVLTDSSRLMGAITKNLHYHHGDCLEILLSHKFSTVFFNIL